MCQCCSGFDLVVLPLVFALCSLYPRLNTHCLVYEYHCKGCCGTFRTIPFSIKMADCSESAIFLLAPMINLWQEDSHDPMNYI